MEFRRVRGMRDLVAGDAERARCVEEALVDAMRSYGYEEVRLPLLEASELFSRGVGEATDIVEKEMYTFLDRGGKQLSLRPEGTASCVRAGIEQGLFHRRSRRLWYAGPMFRYERPQKGRFRQFDQVGAEVFGVAGPEAEAELVQMVWSIWDRLGIADGIALEINTVGAGRSRQAFRDALVAFLAPRADALDADSRRRLDTNPLRILDSKVPSTRALLEGAPELHDFLDDLDKVHFDEMRRLLDELRMPYRVNPRLVRGLDYYTHTVFEWVTDGVGAQDAVCAGGRYDGLVESLGGRATPAAGFAIGVDRVVLLASETQGKIDYRPVDAYWVVLDRRFMGRALDMAQRLRDSVPGLRVRTDTAGGKPAAQFRRADESGARWALIVGEDEIARDRVSVKWLREEREQAMLPFEELGAALRTTC